jgi:hypothetical protein
MKRRRERYRDWMNRGGRAYYGSDYNRLDLGYEIAFGLNPGRRRMTRPPSHPVQLDSGDDPRRCEVIDAVLARLTK